MPDYRSPEAELYRRFYKTARWRTIRATQLAREPFCQRCKAKGHLTQATVCHHIDKARKATHFFEGPFASLCAPCHDGPIQSEEVRGFSTEIGIDGWPTDQNHPALSR